MWLFTQIQKGLFRTQDYFQHVGELVEEKKGEVLDAATEKMVAKVLSSFGRVVKQSLVPPYLPESLLPAVTRGSDFLWSCVEEDLLRNYMTKNNRQYRELGVMFWASRPPPTRKPFTYARAKILYALYPADRNIWWSLTNSPLFIALLVLRLNPLYGTSTLVFCLKFFLIDKTDEFQLVNYVLEFKSFQFITDGLLIASKLAYIMGHCLVLEHEGASNACLERSPGHDYEFAFKICLEPVRLLLIYSACALLFCGCAKGGREEISALENCRLDAADGSHDGAVDREYLRLLRNQEETKYEDVSLRDMHKVLEAHRIESEAQASDGGHLKLFMIYDLMALLATLAVGVVLVPLATNTFLKTSDTFFWTMLYYTKCSYALAALPFLFFGLPIVGPIIHGSMPTGYDQTGALVPKLSSGLIKQKIQADEEAVEEGMARLKAQEAGKQHAIDRDKTALIRRRVLLQEDIEMQRISKLRDEGEGSNCEDALPASAPLPAPVDRKDASADKVEDASRLDA